jgi:hypothetical protein
MCVSPAASRARTTLPETPLQGHRIETEKTRCGLSRIEKRICGSHEAAGRATHNTQKAAFGMKSESGSVWVVGL